MIEQNKENSQSNCEGSPKFSSFSKSPVPVVYRGRSFIEWAKQLSDLDPEMRLTAIDAIVIINSKENRPEIVGLLLKLLKDEKVEVRNRAARGLSSLGKNAWWARQPLKQAIQDNQITLADPEAVVGNIPEHTYAIIPYGEGDPVPISIQNFGWMWALKQIAGAALAWAAGQVLKRFEQDEVKISELAGASVVDIAQIIGVAYDQGKLRDYMADVVSLNKQYLQYLEAPDEERDHVLIVRLMSDASYLTERADGLGLSGIGCFSQAAGLRLLLLQEYALFHGGRPERVKVEANEYTARLINNFPNMHDAILYRFRGLPNIGCNAVHVQDDECETSYAFDGNPKRFKGYGDSCEGYDTRMGRCVCPNFDPYCTLPSDCLGEVCFRDMNSTRNRLENELEQKIGTLQSVTDDWKNIPNDPIK